MEIDRRRFLTISLLAPLGLATISPKLLTTKPIEITTYWGRLTYEWTRAPEANEYRYSSFPKSCFQHEKGYAEYIDFAKNKAMEVLLSDPKMKSTKQQFIDVRDAEIISRAVEKADTLKSKYPECWNWSPSSKAIDLFCYFREKLEKLNPKNDDFTEGYAQHLTEKLLCNIPDKEFEERMDIYHDKNVGYCLPNQVVTPWFIDNSGTLYRGHTLPVSFETPDPFFAFRHHSILNGKDYNIRIGNSNY